MIEILTMAGAVQRRYLIDQDRFIPEWFELHRKLVRTLLDRPDARVVPAVPDAPYLEYGTKLPAWADHSEFERHQWIMGYDRPGSAAPIYAGFLVPPRETDMFFLSSGLAMISAILSDGTDGSFLLPEIAAAEGDSLLIGGYTPGALSGGENIRLVSQFLSESVACFALTLLEGHDA